MFHTADYINFGTLLLGIAVAFFGILPYREAQRWKVSEFVASEMRLMFDDASVRAACKILDWDSGTVIIEDLHKDGNRRSLNFDRALAISSLAVDRDDRPAWAASLEAASPSGLSFTDTEEIVRCLFDDFFTALERLNSYIDPETELFSARKLKPYLAYYLEIVNEDDDFGLALRRFAEYYDYRGAERLVTEITGKAWRGVA